MSVLEEKVSISSVEPLVLRPPVGSEIHGNPDLRFRTFFAAVDNPFHRKRFLRIFCMSVLLAILLIAIFVFTWSILGFGPIWLPHPTSHRSGLLTRPRQSACHVVIPALRLRLTETISADDNMFNVTILPRDSPMMQKTRILYLCKDRLTVIRTSTHCFIRPMQDEWYQLCTEGFTNLLQRNPKVPDSVEADVKDQLWFPQPTKLPPTKFIDNAFVYHWCEGASPFWLVTEPPANGYVVDSLPRPLSEQKPDESLQQSTSDTINEGFQEVLNAVSSQDPGFIQETDLENSRPGSARFARQVRPHEERVSADQIKESSVVHCTELPSVIEGAVIPADFKKPVSVIRDRLIMCPA